MAFGVLESVLGVGSLALKIAPIAMIGIPLLTGNGEFLGEMGQTLLSGIGDIIVGILGEDNEVSKWIRSLQKKEPAKSYDNDIGEADKGLEDAIANSQETAPEQAAETQETAPEQGTEAQEAAPEQGAETQEASPEQEATPEQGAEAQETDPEQGAETQEADPEQGAETQEADPEQGTETQKKSSTKGTETQEKSSTKGTETQEKSPAQGTENIEPANGAGTTSGNGVPVTEEAKNKAITKALNDSVGNSGQVGWTIYDDAKKVAEEMEKNGYTLPNGELSNRLQNYYQQAYTDSINGMAQPSRTDVNERYMQLVKQDPDLVLDIEKVNSVESFKNLIQQTVYNNEPLNSENNKEILLNGADIGDEHLEGLKSHCYVVGPDGKAADASAELEAAIDEAAKDGRLKDIGNVQDPAEETKIKNGVLQEYLDKHNIKYTSGAIENVKPVDVQPKAMTGTEVLRHAMLDRTPDNGITPDYGAIADKLIDNGYEIPGATRKESRDLLSDYIRQSFEEAPQADLLHQNHRGKDRVQMPYLILETKLTDAINNKQLTYNSSKANLKSVVQSAVSQAVDRNDNKMNDGENLEAIGKAFKDAGIDLDDNTVKEVLENAEKYADGKKEGILWDRHYKNDAAEVSAKTEGIMQELQGRGFYGTGALNQVSAGATQASAGNRTTNPPADKTAGKSAPGHDEQQHTGEDQDR